MIFLPSKSTYRPMRHRSWLRSLVEPRSLSQLGKKFFYLSGKCRKPVRGYTDEWTRSHPSAPDKPPFETVLGLMTAPLDKLGDMLRKFPKEGS